MNESKFEGYKKFILDKLKSLNIDISFIEYLNSYWFRKDIKEFNYSSFIEKYKENDKALQKLYITNNIIESLNSKINTVCNGFVPPPLVTERGTKIEGGGTITYTTSNFFILYY